MQDAAELKCFLQDNKPMLLVSVTDRHSKSHLLSKIIALSDPSHIIFRLKGLPSMQSSTVRDIFLKHWAISQNKNSALSIYETMDHIIQSLTAQHQVCLLVIEQAHLLSLSVWSILSYLCAQQENQPICIRIILSGYPDIVTKMNMFYANKSKPAVINLTPTPMIIVNKRRFLSYPRLSSFAMVGLFFCGFFVWKMHPARVSLQASASPHPSFSKTGIHRT